MFRKYVVLFAALTLVALPIRVQAQTVFPISVSVNSSAQSDSIGDEFSFGGSLTNTGADRI